MSDTLNALAQQQGQSNLLNILSSAHVANPAAALQAGTQAAGSVVDLRQKQFNLQQAQLGPAYQAMRMLAATNSNPSNDDIKAALGGAARIGGNVDNVVQNLSDWTARGGKPADFVRAYALGGMSPENQALIGIGSPAEANTGAAILTGLRGGALSSAPGVFTPGASIGTTLSPAQATDMVQVGVNPDGSPKMVPRWQISGSGAPGVGSAGAAPGGGGGLGTPASAAVNNFGNIRAPGGGFASYATPQDGVAAMASNLTAYQDQHGINTLNGITARWAPAGDGANDPAAYARTLSQLTGIDPNAPLNLHDPATLAKIIPAIAQVEHGRPLAVGGDVVNAGISAGLTGRPGGSVASGPAPAGPFVGATSAQPVIGGSVVQPGGGGGANVRPAGGMQYFDPYGRPVAGPGGGTGGPPAGGYTGYTGLPAGFEQTVLPQIGRANQLQQGLAADIQTRATLRGMEAELNNLPATGVPSGPLGALRNLAVSSGLVSQQTADSMAKTQAAQEQFEKFASLLQQQQLGALTGQATDERQALTAASTPSLLHTKLGNLGIIHMLEGNQSALQVMGRAWQDAVSSGQATPQQFDAWRNQFTAIDKNGARFDPRVFWMAQMEPAEQRAYGSGLTAKDQQQLKRNVQFAEQKGWIFANQDGSFGTAY